jgi:hypothetical protein
MPQCEQLIHLSWSVANAVADVVEVMIVSLHCTNDLEVGSGHRVTTKILFRRACRLAGHREGRTTLLGDDPISGSGSAPA